VFVAEPMDDLFGSEAREKEVGAEVGFRGSGLVQEVAAVLAPEGVRAGAHPGSGGCGLGQQDQVELGGNEVEVVRDEAASRDAGTIIAVDALPEAYYSQQHFPGAVNLIAADVEDRAGRLLPDKAAAIVTYCSNPACQNSTQVAMKLERLGYTDVRKYTDGIEDWVGAGLPTQSG
jgi:rhodanese-related sulfurtransferase